MGHNAFDCVESGRRPVMCRAYASRLIQNCIKTRCASVITPRPGPRPQIQSVKLVPVLLMDDALGQVDRRMYAQSMPTECMPRALMLKLMKTWIRPKRKIQRQPVGAERAVFLRSASTMAVADFVARVLHTDFRLLHFPSN